MKSVKVSVKYAERDIFGGGERYSIVAMDKDKTLALVKIEFKTPSKPVASRAAAVKALASYLVEGEREYLLKPLPKPGVLLSSNHVRLKPEGKAEIPAIDVHRSHRILVRGGK
ncbi:MAG: hypothetical protein H8E53_09185 [Planctomycetes bacterium]|nr:hypothetical protein [Planctomycetota bacterium]